MNLFDDGSVSIHPLPNIGVIIAGVVAIDDNSNMLSWYIL